MNEKFECISDVIKNRRAIYPVQYSDVSIDLDIVHQILRLANWAPTHKRTEPWRFIVFGGKAKERLGAFLADEYKNHVPTESFDEKKSKKFVFNCERSQYVIMINIQYDQKNRLPEWEELAATAMAVQNMWLGCSALGIGAYWSSPIITKSLDKLVSMSDGEHCIGLFYMGMPAVEWPIGMREPIEDKIALMME